MSSNSQDNKKGRSGGSHHHSNDGVFKLARHGGNHAEWRRLINNALEQNHGLLGRCGTDGKYFEYPEEVVLPEEYTKEKDPLGLKLESLKLQMRRKESFLSEMEREKPKAYAFVMSKLSAESQEALTTHEKHTEVLEKRDVLGLLDIIRVTHMTNTGGLVPWDTEATIEKYYALRQGESETLLRYKERFVALVETAQQQGVEIEEESSVLRFMRTVNSHYQPIVQDLIRMKRQLQDAFELPTSITAAYAELIRGATELGIKADTQPTTKTKVAFVAREDTVGKKGPAAHVTEAEEKKNKSNNFTSHKKGPKKPGPCPLCGELHWVSKCPSLDAAKAAVGKNKNNNSKKNSSRKEHAHVATHLTDDDDDCDIFMASVVDSENEQFCALTSGGLGNNQILLDNQASISIFKDKELLTDIASSKNSTTIQGIGGAINVDEEGNFADICRVLYSPKSPANILSMSEMVSQGHIVKYEGIPDEFHLTTKNKQTLIFSRPTKEKGSLYVYDGSEFALHTIENRERLYTKREVAAAKEAIRFVESMCFPSINDAKFMISTGSVVNCPVTVADLDRAQDIYGTHVAVIKGKSTKATAAAIPEVPSDRKITRTDQELDTDIMFINNSPYLISVALPLRLTLCNAIKGKKRSDLLEAVDEQINILKLHKFNIIAVHCDGEKGVMTLESKLQERGIQLHNAAPGTHAANVERKIRVIKERLRCVLNNLPFKLPESLMKYAVSHVVAKINAMPNHQSIDVTPARELLTGRKLDFKRDIGLPFGTYVQVFNANTTRNSLEPRTEAAIALTTTGNIQGAMKFFLVKSCRVVTRDQWKELPLPTELVEELNRIASAEAKGAIIDRPLEVRTKNKNLDDESEKPTQPTPQTDYPRRHAVVEAPHVETELDPELPQASTDTAEEVTEDREEHVQDDVQHPTAESTSVADPVVEQNTISETQKITIDDEVGEIIVEDTAPPDSNQAAEQDTPQVAPRPQRGRRPPSRYLLTALHVDNNNTNNIANINNIVNAEHAFHISVKQGIERFGEAARTAIAGELTQLMSIPAWEPVNTGDISTAQREKIIRTHMFLKDKHKADGSFDKLKARLVARGDMQEELPDERTSSPTVGLTAALVTSGIAAKERRHVATVDVTGAFLNAEMGDEEILVKLDKTLSEIVCQIDPTYEAYKETKGTITVRLLRALYGTQQASLLWYNHLTRILKQIGFEVNPYELCVMNRGHIKEKTQITIAIYVDDLLITALNAEDLEQVISEIREHFKQITVHTGKVHSYLGMLLDFTEAGTVAISMRGYTESVLRDYGIEFKPVNTPALVDLYEIDEDAELLNAKDTKKFHTFVARLLYLSKRTRPDIMLPVNFLSTRVKSPNQKDLLKLERVLKYLQGTLELGIKLQPNENVSVNAHVDASYASHADAKGHTGIAVAIGKGPIFVRSAKQKLVARSSTEAELIGLADSVTQVIWCREFLAAQGYRMPEAIIYQDNQSTITLAEKGKSTSDATRHINVRFFFINEKINNKEIKLVHKGTNEMLADLLTKPLQGNLFRRLRAMLLNWKI